jgi:predicted nucleic acid-binding protein
VARPEKTEPVFVCVDADVLIAGLLSRTGASHAILVLGELGRERARELADAKDVAILVAAIGAGAGILVTHNIRHFRSGEGVRVVRPRTLIEEARAWMGSFGR